MNNQISRVGQGITPKIDSQKPVSGESRASFDETLKQFVTDVNSLQNQASESIEKLATGEIADVHQVMIAVNEAIRSSRRTRRSCGCRSDGHGCLRMPLRHAGRILECDGLPSRTNAC